MSDRTAATAGFTVAGLTFAVALLPWPDGFGVAAAAASAVAAVGFGLRRHGYLDRRVGAPLAGLAGLGVVVIALSAIVGASTAIGVGPGTGTAGGVLTVVAAYADYEAVSREGLVGRAREAAVAAAVGAAGLVAIVLWSVVLGSFAPRTPSGGIDPSIGTVLSAVALGLGTGTVAVFYLRATDRGLEFVDVSLPGRRGAVYVVGGVIAIVGVNLGIGYVFERLGVESATHSIIRAAESDPEILLILIPLSYLIIGPGEELLFRNIVQKSLYGAFSRRGAVVVASAVFAGAHVFAYSGTSPAATLNTLLVIFTLALVLGEIYARTQNVVVPALVHGSFNAIAFAVTYARLTGVF